MEKNTGNDMKPGLIQGFYPLAECRALGAFRDLGFRV